MNLVNKLLKAFAMMSTDTSADMDEFSTAFAPGVSALNARGITPDFLFGDYLTTIFDTKKVISVDFAEVNPVYDIDNRTSKLAARLIFEIVEML